MVWDIPLDYISEPPDNWTDFNDTYSTLDTRWSTTNLQNGTTFYEYIIFDFSISCVSFDFEFLNAFTLCIYLFKVYKLT